MSLTGPGSEPMTPVRQTVLVLVLLVPIGFLSKHYSGPAEVWINGSLSGVLYELFWCLLGALLCRRTSALGIAITVLAGTCVLEVLQLFDWAVLRFARSFYLGRVLIGTTFVPSDFIYYGLGCLAGWWAVVRLKHGPGSPNRTQGGSSHESTNDLDTYDNSHRTAARADPGRS